MKFIKAGLNRIETKPSEAREYQAERSAAAARSAAASKSGLIGGSKVNDFTTVSCWASRVVWLSRIVESKPGLFRGAGFDGFKNI